MYITIEVAFATPQKQIIIRNRYDKNITAIEVLQDSKIWEHFPEYFTENFDLSNLNIGVFGKKIDIKYYIFKDYDRLEIYRPLHLSPNEVRLKYT